MHGGLLVTTPTRAENGLVGYDIRMHGGLLVTTPTRAEASSLVA